MSGRPGGGRKEMGEGRYQVEVVAHQAPRVNLPVGFFASLGQGLEKILPIHIIVIDPLTTIATAHDVVDHPGILNSQRPRHSSQLSSTDEACQAGTWGSTSAPPRDRCAAAPCYRLTPPTFSGSTSPACVSLSSSRIFFKLARSIIAKSFRFLTRLTVILSARYRPSSLSFPWR